jgi:hypothetical protein
MRKLPVLFLLIILTGCGPSPEDQATLTAAAWTETPTPTSTFTPTATFTATATPTQTVTPTPTITPTPTFAFPAVTVNKQAHCRYGPSTAYLHAADLYPGDAGSVRGRAFYSQWLYVKFDKLNYFCWVAPSVVDVAGDVNTVKKTEPNLLSIGSNRYGPPQNVQVTRNEDLITVTWDPVPMTGDDDRGYFIEAFVCQDGAYLWWTESFPDQTATQFTVRDEAGCAAPSMGKLYTVEKHGYSNPVEIPWIPP